MDEFFENMVVVIKRKNVKNRKFWQELESKKARIVSLHTRAAAVELLDTKEMFIINIKDLQPANESD